MGIVNSGSTLLLWDKLKILTIIFYYVSLLLGLVMIIKILPPAIWGVLCFNFTPLIYRIKLVILHQTDWLINQLIAKSGAFLGTPKRYFCSSSLDNETDRQFYEWFSGITDSEGSFRFERIKGLTYQFIFIILLHIDDIDTLHYIKDRLGIGSVKTYGNTARFTITSRKDIEKLINIFSKYPLNSTKLLNYLDFKRAFELYLGNKNKTEDLALEMEKIKSKMNRSRSDFQLPEGHRPVVTAYWLLGFVEGDGSFHLDRSSNRLIFDLTLSGVDLTLLEGIKDYLYNLPGVDKQNMNKASIMIYLSKGPSVAAHLSIKNTDFIKYVIIPFFSSMTWHSKKFLDFQDWVLIFKLKEKGHHYTDEGLRLIELITSQTNNNRLSTSKLAKIDRGLLHADVQRVLSGDSNYENRGDRIYIKSLNRYLTSPKAKVVQLVDVHSGEILNTYSSLTACAKYLGMSQSSVWVKYTKGESFLFKGSTQVMIKREVPSSTD